MCKVLQVSHGGFYDWLKRPESARAIANRTLLLEIKTAFERSFQTYGPIRVRRDLQELGQVVGRHRVARLMRLNGLKVVQKRRRHKYPNFGPPSVIAPNVLDRQFTVSTPNTAWVGDITYIWTGEGWLYLAAVLDLFSRRVVGWAMGPRITRDLANDALLMALFRRRPKASLLHHSDQGCQYTSEDFQRLLTANGVECSMSRRGDCYDNAVMESFFGTLKKERVHRRIYQTREDAKADVFDYIEGFYNPRRRHSTLGLLSPMEFERRAAEH